VRLPGMSGLELQRQIVAANWRIPIIFVTAHADDAVRAHALEGGAIDFLYKPFREEELLDAIDSALKRS
jgi:FixJ family two-component response regulator